MPSGIPCCWDARAISRSHGRALSVVAAAAPALQINRAATNLRRHVLVMTRLLVGLALLSGLLRAAVRLSRRIARTVERALRLRRWLLLAGELRLRLPGAALESIQRAVLDGRNFGDVARRLHQVADRIALLVQHLARVLALGGEVDGHFIADETKAHGDVAERRRLEIDGQDLERLIRRVGLGRRKIWSCGRGRCRS